VMISLNEQGRELIERILPEVSAETTAAYAGFTQAELAQLSSLTARVLRNLEGGG